MIETTFIRLEKAAEMLGTDIDTILIASTEGRLKLFGLLSKNVYALKYASIHVCLEIFDNDLVESEGSIWVDYAPLGRIQSCELLKFGECQPFELSEVESDDTIWVRASFVSKEDCCVDLKSVFAKRSDIISIKSNAKLPEPNSVSDYSQKKSGETKRANTLLTIIEACLDQLHRDPCERGLATDMAKWTEATDNCLDAGTIRPILKQLSKNVDFDKQNKR